MCSETLTNSGQTLNIEEEQQLDASRVVNGIMIPLCAASSRRDIALIIAMTTANALANLWKSPGQYNRLLSLEMKDKSRRRSPISLIGYRRVYEKAKKRAVKCVLSRLSKCNKVLVVRSEKLPHARMTQEQ